MKAIILEKGVDVFDELYPFSIAKGEAQNVLGADGMSCSEFKWCTSPDKSKQSKCRIYSGLCTNQLGCGVYRFVSDGTEPVIP